MSAPIDQLAEQFGLTGVFADSGRSFAIQRLEEFFATYRARAADFPTAPQRVGWAELEKVAKTNPLRVRALLQAVAFMCSPEMLTVVWLVQYGAQIERVSFQHQREVSSRLSIDLRLAESEPQSFQSEQHWDAAILRFFALTMVDEVPVISSLLPIHLALSED